jgi:hypothetical protein
MIYLHDILPSDISPETAFHLTNFAMDLALAIESHYFPQLRRYEQEENQPELPEFLRKK